MVKLKYDLMTATDVLLKVVWMKISVPAELQESVDSVPVLLVCFHQNILNSPLTGYDYSTLQWNIGVLTITLV